MHDTTTRVDLTRLSVDTLYAIAIDHAHPQSEAAEARLDALESDFWSRHTPAGGEA